MKTHLLNAGGTIASTKTGSGRDSTMTVEELVEYVPKLNKFDIETKDVFIKDSSNIKPADWSVIAEKVDEAFKENAEGIVIAHGTDTMAYSASALSFMSSLDIPVIFTGGQKSIGEKETDAKDNLYNSVLAAQQLPPSVYLVFDNSIFLGCTTTKIDSIGYHAFETNWKPVGKISGENIKLDSDAVNKIKGLDFENNEMDINIDTSVGLLKIYPGFDTQLIDAVLSDKRGLIVEGLGAGNCPVGYTDIVDKIKYWSKQEKIIGIVTQCPFGASTGEYAAGKEIIDAGAISLGKMTTEAAFTKLSFLISHYDKPNKIKEEMLRNYRGELF